jgi:hypothetical protein
MTRISRNRFVAWLGIAAMWLAIVVPVVSQSIAARENAADPQAPICSAEFVSTLVSVALGDEHGEHQAAAPAAHDSHHASSADHFAACSYCGLLAHHLSLRPGDALHVSRVERVTRVARIAIRAAVHTKTFNAAHPRAPPVIV